MLKKITLKGLLLILTIPFASAQHITVGLEAFPPVIEENGQGLLVTMLKTIEQESPLTFQVEIMTYERAKNKLKQGQIDIVGLTPKGFETEDFYQYAQDIDWSFNVNVDLFSKQPNTVAIKNLINGSIGTLVGNADFFSEVTSIPRDKFVEVSNLEQLVKLLGAGRIDAVLFERISMLSTIQKLNQSSIYYNHLTTLPASLAVGKTKSGLALKNKLDQLIKTIDTAKYLAPYAEYAKMPKRGKVEITKY